jgi:hypothetical protein
MIREVCSVEKAPVEKVEIKTAQASAGHQSFNQRIYITGAVERLVRNADTSASKRRIIRCGSSALPA